MDVLLFFFSFLRTVFGLLDTVLLGYRQDGHQRAGSLVVEFSCVVLCLW